MVVRPPGCQAGRRTQTDWVDWGVLYALSVEVLEKRNRDKRRPGSEQKYK